MPDRFSYADVAVNVELHVLSGKARYLLPYQNSFLLPRSFAGLWNGDMNVP